MSVIAWDGRTLAADRQGTQADHRIVMRKIKRLPNGDIIASCNSAAVGILMMAWYEKGADLHDLPEAQNGDDWARLVAVKTNGEILTYEQYGSCLQVLDCPAAWGCGRDYAIGAMAMGADARKAIEVASEYSVYCGMGVEAFDIEPAKKKAIRCLSKAYAMTQKRKD